MGRGEKYERSDPETKDATERASLSDAELTQDGVFSRAVTLWQPRRGYRFGIDSLLLADFARRPAEEARVLDLGTGVGVVALALAFRVPEIAPPAKIVGVELQPRLACLAARNFAENHLAAKPTLLEADLKSLPGPLGRERFDLIVANPPYHAAAAQPSSLDERALARREIASSISDVAACAARMSTPQGLFAVIYPAPGLSKLYAALSSASYELTALRPVYPKMGAEAHLILALAKRKTGKLPPPVSVLPPLTIADARGQHLPAIELLLRRGF